jgi:hypothetical protein
VEYEIAQLRHAYTHLIAERVRLQREFADGLIAPAIRMLERLAAFAPDTIEAFNEAERERLRAKYALRRAETVKQGSVHEHAVGKADAPKFPVTAYIPGTTGKRLVISEHERECFIAAEGPMFLDLSGIEEAMAALREIRRRIEGRS